MKPGLLSLLVVAASLVACAPDKVATRANGSSGELAFWNDSEVPLRTGVVGAPVDIDVQRFAGGQRSCGGRCVDVPATPLKRLVARCDIGCDVVTSSADETDAALSDRHGRVRVIGRADKARLTVDVVTEDGQALSDVVDLTFAHADEIRVGRLEANAIGLRDAMLVGAEANLEIAAYARGERLAAARDAWITAPEGKAIAIEGFDATTAHLLALAPGKARVTFTIADVSRRFDLRVVDPTEIASAEIWRLAGEDASDDIAGIETSYPSAASDLLHGGEKIDALALDGAKRDDASYALVLTTQDGARVLGCAPLLGLASGDDHVAAIAFPGRDVSLASARRSTPAFTLSAMGEGHDALRLDLGAAHLDVPIVVSKAH